MSIRGLHNHNGVLFAVKDDTLYTIDSAGADNDIGTLGSTAGVLEFASLAQQLAISDGAILYVWDGTTLSQTADYPYSNTIDMLGQRLFFDRLGTQGVGHSELNDAKTLSADFISAETATDKTVGVASGHGELWAFGEYTTEIHRLLVNPPDADTITEFSGNVIEYGCCAPHTIRKAANTFVWLSQDRNGSARVIAATGYQPRRISTRAIEERFDGLDLAGATAFIVSDGPHEQYHLNVPGVDTTLVFDFYTQQWFEKAETDEDGNWMQWRATCHAFAYGQHYFGADDDVIYKQNKNVHLYGTDPLIRSRIAPVIANGELRTLKFSDLKVICETATNANIMVRWKDHPGAEWNNWRIVNTGAVGQYTRLARLLMMGGGRERVFEFRVADDAPWNPVAISMMVT